MFQRQTSSPAEGDLQFEFKHSLHVYVHSLPVTQSALYEANPLDKNERSQLLIIEPIHQKSRMIAASPREQNSSLPPCVWIILRIKFPPIRYLLLRLLSFRSPFVSIVFHEKENCILPRVIILFNRHRILDIRFVSKFIVYRQVELSR